MNVEASFLKDLQQQPTIIHSSKTLPTSQTKIILSSKMTLLKTLFLVVMPLSCLIVEDIKSEKRKEFLQDAQKETVDIADVALKKFDDPKYSGLVKAWFGPDRSG